MPDDTKQNDAAMRQEPRERTDRFSERLAERSGESAEKPAVFTSGNRFVTWKRQPEPHEMTFDEFSRHSTVERLANHGRKWQVNFIEGGKPGSCFSDADDPVREQAEAAAKLDAHRILVNNAIYAIQELYYTPDGGNIASEIKVPWPTMPPQAVLDEYPDIVARFPEVFELGDEQGLETDQSLETDQGLESDQDAGHFAP